MKCFAYVDGSFSKLKDHEGNDVNIYGAGIYLRLENRVEPIEIALGDTNEELAAMRNVAGELRAVCYLVGILDQELPEYNCIDIYYDYEGIEKWVTGEWRANKPATKAYRDLIRNYQKTKKITFHKVEAHSGVLYNERADKLAKQGVQQVAEKLGIPM